MLIFHRFDDWFRERLWRFATNHVMHPTNEPPSLPCREQSWQSVGEPMFESRHHDTPSRARHPLHVTQHERSGNRVRRSCTSSSHYDGYVRPYKLSQQLRFVEVHLMAFFRAFVVFTVHGGQRINEVVKKKVTFYCSLQRRTPRSFPEKSRDCAWIGE